MSVRNSLLVLGTAILLQACAAISNPEGGPQDLESPKLVSSFPEDRALNVSTKTIRLTFSEDVQAPNLNRQLLISPNTEPKYTVRATKNVVELEFDEALEENTTYQLNFREGIVDITEGNKAQNLVLTFSTGPSLDSAQLNGTVKNLVTNTPEANLVVALYPETDTANIRKNKPFYFTHTTTSGTFSFTNIKAGNYWIFAHRDKNNDQLYDNEAETIGYLTAPVTAGNVDTSAKQPIILLTGKADTQKPFILQKTSFTDNYTLAYNEGLSSYTINPTSKAKVAIPTTMAPDGKTLRLFPTTAFTGGSLLITAVDSAYNSKTDTVMVGFTGKPFFTNPGNFKSNVSGSVAADQPIELQFEMPFSQVSPEAFTLIEDTIRTRKLTPTEVTLSEDKTKLTLTPKITAKNNLTIKIDSSQVRSVLNKPVSIKPIKLTIADQLPVGALSGQIKSNYKSFQLELLNANNQVVKTLKNSKTFNYTDLLPGTYTIRVKIDENNNNKWEGINKNLKTLPEKIYFHPKPIEIRANWEIEDYIIEF